MNAVQKDIRNIDAKDFFKKQTLHERGLFLLQYAILAPSTHNSQPWLFQVTEHSCKIYADLSKYLPQGDREKRDMFISIGCALENLLTAASYFNALISWSFVNENAQNNKQLIAEVFLKHSEICTADSSIAERFHAVVKRVNARGMFTANHLLEEKFMSALKTLKLEPDISLFSSYDESAKQMLGQITAEGMRTAHKNVLFRKELSQWIRNRGSARLDGIPWYGLKAPFPLHFFISQFIRVFNLGAMLGPLNAKSIASASLVNVLMSASDTSLEWLRIGMSAERIILTAYAHNLKASVFVAAVEMPELRKKLREFIKTDQLPQFLFVIGYMDEKFKFTPRHSVETKLI